MTVKFNNTEIQDVKYNGVDVEILQYNGVEIWKRSAYQPDEVVFESSTAGNYSLDVLATGRYEVICVGAGGGGERYKTSFGYTYSGGGSGSCFYGEILIQSGNYSINVGKGGNWGSGTQATSGGNSNISDVCISYGGLGAYRTGGAGGSLPSINTTIYSTTINSAGNSGNSGSSSSSQGGASLYNEYGKGGYGNPDYQTSGTDGYIRIIYKGT